LSCFSGHEYSDSIDTPSLYNSNTALWTKVLSNRMNSADDIFLFRIHG
jgi:hypothetical protein